MAPRIVVGVDGSAVSVAALSWALDEAERRHASVEAVHAWRYPYMGDLPGMSLVALPLEEVERAARAVLDGAIEDAGAAGGKVPIEASIVQGDASRVLLDASKGADLLVVGSRGLGGFSGLLLGSVSQQCAHHASCPLVIVPDLERTA